MKSLYFTSLLALYIISLSCSIAGMEAFGWLFAFSLAALWIWKRPFPFIGLGPDWAILGFMVVGILGALFAAGIPTAADRWDVAGEFRWPLLSYCFYAWLAQRGSQRGTKVLERIFLLLFFVTCIVGTFSLYQVFTGADPFRPGLAQHALHSGDFTMWRAKGFFHLTMTYSYDYGMVFCFFFAALLVYVRQANPPLWVRRFLWFGALAIGASLVCTFTRGLWIALGMSVATMGMLYSRKVGAAVVASIVVLGLGLWTASSTFQDRIDSIISLENKSNAQRINIWHINWEMFKDHPLLGVGFCRNDNRAGEYNLKVLGHKDFEGHAHNHFMQVLSGMGIFGFIFFIGIFFTFFRQALRLWCDTRGKTGREAAFAQAVALASIGSQLVFHIGGMTEAVFIDAETLHMFMFLQVILLVTARLWREHTPAPAKA